MGRFKPTQITTIPKIVEPLSEDALFWRKCLEPQKVVKEYGAINALDLHSETNHLLVNSSSKITLYNYNNMEAIRNYNTMSQFSAYGANFRKSDYKLIVAGTEEGKINIYDFKTSKPLRLLSENPKNKHLGPVHCCQFLSYNQVVSTSDDKCIKLWDLASGELIRDIGSSVSSASVEIKPHTDYIRAACAIEDANIIVSGSYDHKVKVWDPRDDNAEPKFTFTLDAPVESIIHRSSLVIASAGKSIKIYDLIAGKLLKSMNNTHSKTITCLYNRDQFIFSASLDGNLKVYNSTFNAVTSISYAPSQLLTVAVNADAVAVGANDGLVIVRRFKPKEVESSPMLGSTRKGLNGYIRQVAVEEAKELAVEEDTMFVKREENREVRLQQYDKALKNFKYKESLDLVLQTQKKPEVVVSVMQELIRRSGLRIALQERKDRDLRMICKFLSKHLRNPQFMRVLVDVTSILTELYTPHINRSPVIRTHFNNLRKIVNSEMEVIKGMMILSGQITVLLNNAIVSDS